MEIKIPVKIISEANSTENWRKKHARHRKQKSMIFYSLNSLQLPLPCIVNLIRISPRRLDSDNLQSGFKYIRDAISEVLIPGTKAGRADDDPRITWIYSQEKGKPKEYAFKIKIEEQNV